MTKCAHIIIIKKVLKWPARSAGQYLKKLQAKYGRPEGTSVPRVAVASIKTRQKSKDTGALSLSI